MTNESKYETEILENGNVQYRLNIGNRGLIVRMSDRMTYNGDGYEVFFSIYDNSAKLLSQSSVTISSENDVFPVRPLDASSKNRVLEQIISSVDTDNLLKKSAGL